MSEVTSPNPVATIILKPREDRRLRNGHTWVFSNEIARVDGTVNVGDVVRVQAGHGALMGTGIYHPNSLITVRLTSRTEEKLDETWFRSRIARALRLREMLFPNEQTYRLLHSESDGVPGVVADRYQNVITVQIAAAGMDLRRDMLFDALMELEGIEGVVERNDYALRTLENLPERIGIVRGTAEPQIISDGILRYHVDPLGGQKTGFYLDQRENRHAMRRFMNGARVLDLFSNAGGFALHARHSGALEVIAVDSSATATDEIQRNYDLNSLDGITIRTADVFAEIKELHARGERFDVVIADPPPFAKSRKNVPAARKKYVALFTTSLALLAPEGTAFLATCSHHITRETFMEMIRESLRYAQRRGVILEERGAAPDHPIHPAMPETGYLHGAIVRVE